MSKHAQEAFAALLQPHFPKLYSLAYRLSGTQADAEDLVQDVLVKLYDQMPVRWDRDEQSASDRQGI